MTTLEEVRSYALARKGTSEDFPFDETTLVIRVDRKMFVLISTEVFPLRINLKCDPERAVELRESFGAVVPGYHQNKRHWNTVILDGSLAPALIAEMIDESYRLVFDSLPAARRRDLS